ncbi:MAG: sulfurtransferase [Flavobacteriales bacterium]|nr:sulfurtransferase [Flavobacteriales bacterium]
MTSPIITPQQLNELLKDDSLILLDVSIPKVTSSSSEFEDKTIPGALVVNLKRDFSDPNGQFPNTVPTPEQFEETCNQLGINNETMVVVFDNWGIYSSPRVWWLFRVMGHEKVYVLNGGLPEWVNAGYPTIDSIPWDRSSMKSKLKGFHSCYQKSAVKVYQDVVNNAEKTEFIIADARSKGRFDGTSPEPREGLKSGHIPHSVCIPFQNVLDGNQFKSKEALEEIFRELKNQNIVYSCGSGLTACIILLAGQLVGIRSMMVYDGSWAEWAETQKLYIL